MSRRKSLNIPAKKQQWKKPSGSEVYEIVRGPSKSEILADTMPIFRKSNLTFLLRQIGTNNTDLWHFWIAAGQYIDEKSHNLIIIGKTLRKDCLGYCTFTAHYNLDHLNGHAIISTFTTDQIYTSASLQ